MLKTASKHSKFHLNTLALILVIGTLTRLLAVHNNIYPHGDVITEVEAADYSNQNGIFTLRHWGSSHELAARDTDHIVITDKPPIWILLIEWYHNLTHQTAYTSAKHLSFLMGITLIVVTYLCIKRLVNPTLALFASSLIAFNHFFIDYSGNGSRYMLTAVLVTLLLYLIFGSHQTIYRYLAIGFIYSLIFQNTYQLATLIIPIIGSLLWITPRKEWFKIGAILPAAAITLIPLLTYNLDHYGIPLLTTNEQYLGNKLGIPSTDVWTGDRFITHYVDPHLITKAFLPALPIFMIKNLIFLTKKTLVIFPVAFVIGWLVVKQYFTGKISKKMWLIAGFLCFYTIQILALNVLKFRYTLITYLLLIMLACLVINVLPPKKKKKLMAFTLVLTILLSITTYLANPYHTYYYDGVLTEDQFRNRGEYNYMKTLESHARFAKNIPQNSVINTDPQRGYFIHNPIVTPSPFSYSGHEQAIINHYQIKYIWSGSELNTQTVTSYQLELLFSQENEYLYRIGLTKN